MSLQNAVVRDVLARKPPTGQGRTGSRTPPAARHLLSGVAGRTRACDAGLGGFHQRRAPLFPCTGQGGSGRVRLSLLHPFMDGNGRRARFLIHHVLTHSGLLPTGTVVPVSAVILKNIPAYLEVLGILPAGDAAVALRARRGGATWSHPGNRAYRFFDASKEAAFTHRMIQQAVEDPEIPANWRG